MKSEAIQPTRDPTIDEAMQASLIRQAIYADVSLKLIVIRSRLRASEINTCECSRKEDTDDHTEGNL